MEYTSYETWYISCIRADPPFRLDHQSIRVYEIKNRGWTTSYPGLEPSGYCYTPVEAIQKLMKENRCTLTLIYRG